MLESVYCFSHFAHVTRARRCAKRPWESHRRIKLLSRLEMGNNCWWGLGSGNVAISWRVNGRPFRQLLRVATCESRPTENTTGLSDHEGATESMRYIFRERVRQQRRRGARKRTGMHCLRERHSFADGPRSLSRSLSLSLSCSSSRRPHEILTLVTRKEWKGGLVCDPKQKYAIPTPSMLNSPAHKLSRPPRCIRD